MSEVDGIRLPDRFVAHGVIGRGGQAVVVLATDQLRGERVALKIVHAHLASDPIVRRRLMREIQAASLLHSDAALVPYELHEVGGGALALSMPFHPGRTVAERVASEGPLPVEDVRAIGARVARALADAHAAGILHRDVSASNVMIGDDCRATTVLADFGLARLAGQDATMTRAAATYGYAAPEVLAGGRGDARSDLYGLGAVLHLAATGRTVPDGKRSSVRDLRPELPADLADTIDALLAKDPSSRPESAAEVVDALEQRVAAGRPPEAPSARARQFFAPGRYAVVVRETGADHDRRRELRRRARRRHPDWLSSADVDLLKRTVSKTMRGLLGLGAADPATPEERLVRAVALEAGVDPADLETSPILLQRRFVLVEAVDRGTADRLVAAATLAGFHASAEEHVEPVSPGRSSVLLLGVLAGAAMVASLVLASLGMDPGLFRGLAMVLAIVAGVRAVRASRDAEHEVVTPAYDAHLTGALHHQARAEPRFESAEPTREDEPRKRRASPRREAPRQEPSAPPSRGAALLKRAEAALDALEEVPDLPEPARADVRATVKDLRRQATALAAEIDRLERAAASHGASDQEMTALASRLARLRALEASGERQDPATLASLERALAQHEADRAAADEVESKLSASTARLLEIASTASRVRRELLASPTEKSVTVDVGLERLHAQARAVAAARREMAR